MKKEQGLTLVELMVGITIGILVLTGAIQFYLNVFRSNADGVRLQRFEQTVHVLAESIVSDLRRAGYARVGISPELKTVVPLNKSYEVQNSGKCVLFKYSNNDPADNLWKQYRYGYQLSDQVIYYYESNSADGNCGNLSGWVALTNTSQILITNTDAQPVFVSTGSLVDIHLLTEAVGVTAQGGGAISRDLTVSVNVRND